jgi:hypothetical protein
MILFRSASAGLGKTEAANDMILKMARLIVKRSNERATAAQAWKADPAHNGKMEGFEAAWNAKLEAEPLFIQNEDGSIAVNDGGAQAPAPAPAPAGTPAPTAPAGAPGEDPAAARKRKYGLK